MTVKAKFLCTGTNTEDQQTGSVTLNAVVAYGPKGERLDGNEQWSEATPSGTINMHVSNPEAFKQFEPGKNYFITFEQES